MSYKVVIAEDEPITRMDIREILENAGYDVVAEASDGFDAVEMCRKHRPHLVLMDIKMPLLDGLKSSRMIREEKIAGGILLLTAYSGKEFIDQAKEIGVMGYVVKPVKEESLLPMLEVAVSKCEEIAGMEQRILDVQEELENRKTIAKAKGILMKAHRLNEDAAYKRIRKLSMEKRCSMKEIARVIILNG